MRHELRQEQHRSMRGCKQSLCFFLLMANNHLGRQCVTASIHVGTTRSSIRVTQQSTRRLEEQNTFSTDAKLAPELVHFFQIPTHLLTTVYRRLNGFSSSAETFSQDGELQSICKEPIKHAVSKHLLILHHRHVVPRPGQDGRSRCQLKLQLT
jgi:hypothetical protein